MTRAIRKDWCHADIQLSTETEAKVLTCRRGLKHRGRPRAEGSGSEDHRPILPVHRIIENTISRRFDKRTRGADQTLSAACSMRAARCRQMKVTTAALGAVIASCRR